MVERETLYPEVEVRVFEGDERLSVSDAMSLLGWCPPDEGEKWTDYTLKDLQKRTIKCLNVDMQRPFYSGVCRELMFDILRGDWEFNGETFIVGETGLVIDGKHRLIAMVLAEQELERRPDKYPGIKSVPELEIIGVFGIKETKKVVNTIGTGKPRSLADSLFASGVFGEEDKKHSKKLCKMTEHCVRLLWHRTGAMSNAFDPKIRHATALDFIDRHPGVLNSVKAIFYEATSENSMLPQVLSPGYSAALHYLMSTSSTDPSEYHDSELPNEEYLNFDNEDKTDEFWVMLSSNDKQFKPVVDQIARLNEGGNISSQERVAVVIKGWNAYMNGGITGRKVSVKTKVDDYGRRQLLEDPVIEGIDVGTEA